VKLNSVSDTTRVELGKHLAALRVIEITSMPGLAGMIARELQPFGVAV